MITKIFKINRYKILFVVIFLISLARIIYNFEFEKEGLHSDEIWSFGLSNSYYEPFIFQTADHSEVTNKDVWLSGQVMKDYLSVNSGQRFSYGSVIYNQDNDYHPPLYYLIFHTISSFFPEKISLWFGFPINIFSYAVLMIFIYKLAFEITESETVSLLSCAFYGFSSGAMNTFVFLRMYALLTALAAVSLFLHARIYRTSLSIRNIVFLDAVTFLGALTHHFYLPFAFFLSACFCIRYMWIKDVRSLLAYGLNMMFSVLLSIAAYPATIDHVFSGRTDDPKFTFQWQITGVFNCLFRELFGFEIPAMLNISLAAVFIVIITFLVILSPVLFLIRKSEAVKRIAAAVKNGFCRFFNRVKKMNFMLAAMLLVSAGMIFVTALSVSLMLMSYTIDRYIFFIYPPVCICFVCIIYYGLSTGKLKRYAAVISSALCFAVLCISNLNFGCAYLFEEPDDSLSTKEIVAGADCVFITDENWLSTCFAWEAVDSRYWYATSDENLEYKIKNTEPPSGADESLYFVIADAAFAADAEDERQVYMDAMPPRESSKDVSYRISKKEFENLLSEKYDEAVYVGHDYMFLREYHIYSVK